MTLDLFGSRLYVLERSIYLDALSFAKRTFGSRNIKYKKNFAETLGSFVNVFGCDCYASCLDISVDLAFKQILFCGNRTDLLQGSELVGGDC